MVVIHDDVSLNVFRGTIKLKYGACATVEESEVAYGY